MTITARSRRRRSPTKLRRNTPKPRAHDTGLVPDADLCLSIRCSRSGLFNYRKRGLLPPPIRLGGKNLNDLAENIAAIKRLARP